MDTWMSALLSGKSDAAWDAFVSQYRRLIFATIRHYAADHDDVMDIFTHVCEGLREDGLRRLRDYVKESEHRARFSTWLVTVVRNRTIDWVRSQVGRQRTSALATSLPPPRNRIFELVFLERRSHVETFELIRTRDAPAWSFREFLIELRATYAAVAQWRGGSVFRELGDVPLLETEQAETVDEYAMRARLLEAAMATLDLIDRAAIELFVVERLPAADVARILGLPNGKSVYNRVYRALAGIREQLEAAGLRAGDL